MAGFLYNKDLLYRNLGLEVMGCCSHSKDRGFESQYRILVEHFPTLICYKWQIICENLLRFTCNICLEFRINFSPFYAKMFCSICPSLQCDQMARFVVQYLATCCTENVPNSMKIVQGELKNFQILF